VRGVALLEGVGNVFEEDQAEDDVFVVGGVHVAAEFVRGLPEGLLEAEVGAVLGLFVRIGLFAARHARVGSSSERERSDILSGLITCQGTDEAEGAEEESARGGNSTCYDGNLFVDNMQFLPRPRPKNGAGPGN
jgi:hypothetical protein